MLKILKYQINKHKIIIKLFIQINLMRKKKNFFIILSVP